MITLTLTPELEAKAAALSPDGTAQSYVDSLVQQSLAAGLTANGFTPAEEDTLLQQAQSPADDAVIFDTPKTATQYLETAMQIAR